MIVWRDGMEYKQKFARGKPVTNMSCHVLSFNSEKRQGTCIKFMPDKESKDQSFFAELLSVLATALFSLSTECFFYIWLLIELV